MRNGLPSGVIPTFACYLREAQGGFAIDQRHRVVKGRIGFAQARDTASIVRAVLASIPSATGEVEPAGKSDGVIDHHYFLVMRAGHGMRIVESKVHAVARLPSEAIGR